MFKDRTIEIDAGLTKHQYESLHRSFSTHSFSGPEDSEGYALYGEDGYCLRIRLWESADYEKTSSIRAELITKKLDDDTLRIILDIALSTNMILIDSIGKNARYIGRDPTPQDLEKWSDAVRLDTIDELRTWLTEHIVGRPVDIYPDEY